MCARAPAQRFPLRSPAASEFDRELQKGIRRAVAHPAVAAIWRLLDDDVFGIGFRLVARGAHLGRRGRMPLRLEASESERKLCPKDSGSAAPGVSKRKK